MPRTVVQKCSSGSSGSPLRCLFLLSITNQSQHLCNPVSLLSIDVILIGPKKKIVCEISEGYSRHARFISFVRRPILGVSSIHPLRYTITDFARKEGKRQSSPRWPTMRLFNAIARAIVTVGFIGPDIIRPPAPFRSRHHSTLAQVQKNLGGFGRTWGVAWQRTGGGVQSNTKS